MTENKNKEKRYTLVNNHKEQTSYGNVEVAELQNNKSKDRLIVLSRMKYDPKGKTNDEKYRNYRFFINKEQLDKIIICAKAIGVI